MIQLDQNQFRTFCPNGSWFFRTFWNFLGQIIKARKSLYCGFSSGWGLASLSPFPLQNSVWSLLDFGMKNVNFCCFLGDMFAKMCDVMSSPLQNHKCNILPRMVSHVNKLDEIKGSNSKRIRSYLHFGQPNKFDWFTLFADAKLTGITENHKKINIVW